MELVVTSIINQFPQGGIFSAQSNKGEKLRVKYSQAIWPVVGDTFFVTGPLNTYKDKYKRKWYQIEAEKIEIITTSGALIKPWLENIKLVGPTRANRLINVFEDELIEKLSDPIAIEEIAWAIEPKRPALGRKIAAIIQAQFIQKQVNSDTALAEYTFYKKLEKYGVSSIRIARKLWRLIGSIKAENTLLTKPYLCASLMSWQNADYLGKRLLTIRGEKGNLEIHPERLAGACDAACRKLISQGHTAARIDFFKTYIPSNISKTKAIEEGLKAHAIVQEGDFIRAPGAMWLEKQCAVHLKKISTQRLNKHFPKDLSNPLHNAETTTKLNLTNEQRQAVLGIVRSPLSILHGGAGVGKTTVMKALIELWETYGGNVVMTCLSGKAALTLSRATSMPKRPRLAYTIARLIILLKDRENSLLEGKTVSPDQPYINEDTLVIIDESSMADLTSIHKLLQFIKKGSHVLFVGDHGQLPPVGLGKIFHDLVENQNNVFSLTKIMRQAEDSQIPQVANAVRTGNVPNVPSFCKSAKGVHFLKTDKKYLREKVANLQASLNESTETLVCAALKETVETINSLSSQPNSNEPAIRLNPFAPHVRKGDPVVCIRNNYKNAIFNGLLGNVIEITKDGVWIFWDGETEARLMPPDVYNDIHLAYAITCHKAQGSETNTVIIPLEKTQLLTREWLYTAITRAKEAVILVGQREDFVAAINRRTFRQSCFLSDYNKAKA